MTINTPFFFLEVCFPPSSLFISHLFRTLRTILRQILSPLSHNPGLSLDLPLCKASLFLYLLAYSFVFISLEHKLHTLFTLLTHCLLLSTYLSSSLPLSSFTKYPCKMAMYQSYYQPASLPINVPSKGSAGPSLYPISRVSGSPPEVSDGSTAGGSRASGFSIASGSFSGDCDSNSSLSYSGVDVVDVLSDRMQNVFDPAPLDKGLAMQAQT